MSAPNPIPDWLVWRQRPFPDSNLIFVDGQHPAMIDSGFVGHARETAEWVQARTHNLQLVVNTHWHSDHVGGNGLLQAFGAGIAASAVDAAAIADRDPGCCVAEYLDQPVAAYSIDVPLIDNQVLRLGDTDWEVISTPGHTSGHIALWQPDARILAVGDALSDYDVGWVNLALDGQAAATTAVASLSRLRDLSPRVVLPAHGRIPPDPSVAFDNALRRAQRLVDDPDGAVWYGMRRIFAFALMIRGGIATAEVNEYLHARAWLRDAARLLATTPQELSKALVDSMVTSGSVLLADEKLVAAAEHEAVSTDACRVAFPRHWQRL